MASLTAHHNLTPRPLALLSITGIATFQHPFFSSSACPLPAPPSESDVAAHLSGPITVGVLPSGTLTVFTLDKLTPDGAKNDVYTPPAPAPGVRSNRGDLYDYYLFHNLFPVLVGDIDPGYGPGTQVADWPPTVLIHGNADPDVALDVSLHMHENLGGDKVKLFVAEGQGHLFEDVSWWEDETEGMGVVREAVACLDGIV
ncbi:hypothetical protein IMZ48_11915, partial [Candidatus Bathyarchaeota archaeon]|nr:hypothetical protein [Candidatus Bathyarchaeota archaeon]